MLCPSTHDHTTTTTSTSTSPPPLQFLALLKLMDYSLLVGIHDVERAEQEEVESEDNEGEDDGESDGGVGTPPDSPSNTLDSAKPLSPGEFDPTIDVYAIKSNDGESRPPQLGLRRFNPSSIGSLARPLSGNNLLCVWLVMQNREKQNCVRVFLALLLWRSHNF